MRKDVIFAVLLTFCLTVIMFMVVPTRSKTTTGTYDPWADVNGDGQIDMYDIGYPASMFLASGDPTKNVNVTNFPQQDEFVFMRYKYGEWSSPLYSDPTDITVYATNSTTPAIMKTWHINATKYNSTLFNLFMIVSVGISCSPDTWGTLLLWNNGILVWNWTFWPG